ncbi:hypothetical protein [Saccharothrix sp. HUAS TT1]|uniref:hypothetical protein n=1 Tax=unclassified Saccharothrix TaxID=2593673 RepID=UPI00345BC893
MDAAEASRHAREIAADVVGDLDPAGLAYVVDLDVDDEALDAIRGALADLAARLRREHPHGEHPAGDRPEEVSEDDGPEEEHEPTGRMVWPPDDGTDGGRHASIVVCDRARCRTSASAWVRSRTGHDGTFLPFRHART